MDPNRTRPMSPAQMLQELRRRIPEVTSAETKEQIESGEAGLILDVREPDEWAQGHIPGAVHVPLGLLEARADPASPASIPELTEQRDRRVIVQCASGIRSLYGADMLLRMGYTDAVSLAGGIHDWEARGFPVE